MNHGLVSMNHEITRLLRSSRAEDRAEAIKQLARTESDEALRYLARVYQNDPDFEIRELALKAGQYIKKKQHAGGWEADVPDDGDAYYEDEYESESFVDQKAIERANSLVERAVDALVRDDKREAAQLAQQALVLNPQLADDSYFTNLAGDILNMEGAAALGALARMEAAPDAKKAKRKQSSSSLDDEVTMNTVLVDLAIVAVVVGGISFLFSMLQTWLVTSAFGLSSAQLSSAPQDIAMMTQVYSSVASLSITLALFNSLFQAIGFIIGWLIWLFIIHMVSTMMLSGVGTYAGLIHRMTIPVVVTYIGSIVIGSVFSWMSLSSLASGLIDPSGASIAGIFDTINLILIMSLFGYVGTHFWYGYEIGNNYDFRLGNGCVSIILSYVVLAAFGCGCMFVLQSLLIRSIGF